MLMNMILKIPIQFNIPKKSEYPHWIVIVIRLQLFFIFNYKIEYANAYDITAVTAMHGSPLFTM